jgi:hypothetical protein
VIAWVKYCYCDSKTWGFLYAGHMYSYEWRDKGIVERFISGKVPRFVSRRLNTLLLL